jgi:hypothetical protein
LARVREILFGELQFMDDAVLSASDSLFQGNRQIRHKLPGARCSVSHEGLLKVSRPLGLSIVSFPFCVYLWEHVKAI